MIPLGGHRPDDANDIARAMRTLIGSDVRLAVLLDRDYRSDEEVEELEARLQRDFTLAHILRRKEIENYFLTPSVVSKTLEARRRGNSYNGDICADDLLSSITDSLLEDAESSI